jgi:thiamine biosynthesis lipoprotein
MLDQLVELGYDRTWSEVQTRWIPADDHVVQTNRPACEVGIELYPDICAVQLPDGARFDPGGIGKGLAADMVAAALLDAGAESAQIELGGDVRLVGRAWNGGDWVVDVDDTDHGGGVAATIGIPEGGVATSSTMRRRWRRGEVEVHHLLDARTGRPAVTDLDAVTVAAPTLWWAEVVAKVALMAGADAGRRLLEHHGLAGVLVRSGDGARYDVVDRTPVPA